MANELPATRPSPARRPARPAPATSRQERTARVRAAASAGGSPETAAPATQARSPWPPRTSSAYAGTTAATHASSSTARIVEAITQAIVERRLTPGTKLAEQRIADVFRVSRTIVRQALNQLSRNKLITLQPARGASVAQPSVREAQQVFDVRRTLECDMVRRLCAVITPAQVSQLRHHLQQEARAVARTDVSGRTTLLADFHVVMALMTGNDTLAEMLQDLVSRSSLIALMYQSAHSAEHSHLEHLAIVDALAGGDARAAVRLMRLHLGNVERNLRLNPRVADLAAALRPHDGAGRQQGKPSPC